MIVYSRYIARNNTSDVLIAYRLIACLFIIMLWRFLAILFVGVIIMRHAPNKMRQELGRWSERANKKNREIVALYAKRSQYSFHFIK